MLAGSWVAMLIQGTLLGGGPEPGMHAHYAALTCTRDAAAPFASVDFVYGPMEPIAGQACVWWQIEARAEDDAQAQPLFQLQACTTRDPLIRSPEALQFRRYLLRIPETSEVLEYRKVHGGEPLLPPWFDFARYFLPQRAKGSGLTDGAPETCEYLGHVLTLRHVGRNVPWTPLKPKVLELDPELLVSTSRNFKDTEGRRLPQTPQKQNYQYTPFVEADYPVMLEAGINLFIVSPEQEKYVRDEPVFYLRGAGKDKPLRYPADLYRSNYVGSQMFMDEPSIIMVGDVRIHKTLKYFSDAAAVIEKRVRAGYESGGNDGAFDLEKALVRQGVSFGDMRLMQYDYPSWETLYDTTYYQMAGGLTGIVHEGRYRVADFDKAVAKWTAEPRRHTPEEVLRYHYAFLRGGSRPFGKHWGTAIYGQCDPAIAPRAMTLAYDMGARYVWFWTSDHDHHVPWPEQLELARTLRKHRLEHPRPSIFGPPPARDLAIVIPYGYFLSVDNLWWVRVMDAEGKNEASARYRRLMRRAHAAIQQAFDRKLDFDITVDDDREITGYRDVLRITDEE
ncbi:MAG TPA: hypothetical protein PKY77_08110 [Phycisphaerae bacterium]|nr:hypothetical protein [Phycisphaerae bacterium]HRY68656.1 hypothetical protein [Phycisphaerae bacterium]HSA25482.1 hypothetical protein [Phycisphaerae bacterium]